MKIYSLAFLLLFQFLSCNQAVESPKSSHLPDSELKQKTDKAGGANIVFKSTDDGQTWQDIGKELPANLQIDTMRGNSFFANDKGLFLKIGNDVYHSTPNTTAPFWTKEIFTGNLSSIAAGKSAKLYWGANLKKTIGTSVWSPIFETLYRPGIRTAFETAGGSIFIGTERGFFKTANNGKTWKHVHTGDFVGHLAELDDVLVAISAGRIIRSTDDGENWTEVSSKDGVAFDVKQIEGGFAAITSTSASGTRRLSTSYDGGKTWQPIAAASHDNLIVQTWNDRPNVQTFQTSIIQVGENFFCTHRDGIFRSSDKGKTWKLLLPSVEGKGFNLFLSGNVIYAIPSRGGC